MATGIQKARMMMATAMIFPTPSGLRNKRATPTEAHTPSSKAQDAEAAMQVRTCNFGIGTSGRGRRRPHSRACWTCASGQAPQPHTTP